MKSMNGGGEAIKHGLVTAEELLRYAMSLPVATTISGMDSLDVLHQNLRVARGFTPMTAAEMQELRARCAPTAADGRYEPYKVTIRYDNPMTRLPHGFPQDPMNKEVMDMLETGIGLPGDALLTGTVQDPIPARFLATVSVGAGLKMASLKERQHHAQSQTTPGPQSARHADHARRRGRRHGAAGRPEPKHRRQRRRPRRRPDAADLAAARRQGRPGRRPRRSRWRRPYLPSPLVPPPAPLPMTNTGPGQIPQKPLGKTGVHVSIIGLGGSSLGDASSLEEAVQHRPRGH